MGDERKVRVNAVAVSVALLTVVMAFLWWIISLATAPVKTPQASAGHPFVSTIVDRDVSGKVIAIKRSRPGAYYRDYVIVTMTHPVSNSAYAKFDDPEDLYIPASQLKSVTFHVNETVRTRWSCETNDAQGEDYVDPSKLCDFVGVEIISEPPVR